MKKRITAVLVALVLIMTQIGGVSLNADSIGTEAAACKELGILIGADASGVTSDYLDTIPTRIQAFIIVLRLKGLYSDATEYEGTDNFVDASVSGWAKNYMAYAKRHPELGWGGYPDGTFAPTDKINGQAFYKVMLETLGYKQDIDFTYANTLKFAQEVGLVKKADDIAKLKSFTVNDVAKGIYGALNTKPQDSDKKLITVMVEQGIIISEKAVAAGFKLDTKDAKVVGFNALTNNRIEVEFDQEIDLQKADVEITQVGGDSRLSILSVDSDGEKATINTTEANPFNAYELTINTLVPTNNWVVKGYSNKFVAMPRDVTKPTVRHELLGRNEILLTFSEEVSRDTAEDVSNYRIGSNILVKSAVRGASGKTVLLETEDMPNDFYGLTVQNVCDLAGNSIETYRAPFDGAQRDMREPSIVSVKSENNSVVTVTFDERVNKDTAENQNNYSVDNGLSILSARLDESGKVVSLSTSMQQTNTIYTLTTQGITDAWGNVMYRKNYAFTGDNTRPTVAVMGVSNNEVMVTFNKKMDKQSAESIGNYMIDKGLEVKDAILDESGKVVTLITSGQTVRELYTITIMQVYDLWGNMINLTSGKFGGMSGDTRELSYSVKSNGNEIVVTFNKRVDKESTENVFNYTLDKELGYAAKATLDDSGRVLTLLTANHSSGKMYTITIKGVKDMTGKALSTDERVAARKFVGMGSSGSGSTDGVFSLETAVTVNYNTLDLIFSDELTDEELEDLDAELDVPDGYSHTIPSSLDFYKYFVGNKKNVRIQFYTGSSKNPELFKSGNIYEIEVMDLDRLNIKNDANVKMFAGTGTPNEEPEIIEVSAINSTAVEVVFSEPVKGITKSQFDIKDDIDISGVSVENNDEITDRVTLYISSKTELDDDEYKLYVRSGIKDAAGLNSVSTGSSSSSSYFEFDGTSDENEAPFIESDIMVLDTHTIQFELSEPINDISNSSFSVRRASGSSSSSISVANAVLSDDEKTVTLYFSSRVTGLDSDYEYELSVSSSVKDLQGLSFESEDRKVEFEGTDNEPEELEIAASYINEENNKITLMFNRELDIDSLDISDFEFSGAGYYKSSTDKVEFDEKSVTITLKNELDNGETFTIKITSGGRSDIKDYNNQKLTTEELEIETN
ncbi:MAG TPA: Ig-like domain-containing protein [Clostridia bacterium]|nr:Ig-like domain-containing protein [Clostridia bacterium]